MIFRLTHLLERTAAAHPDHTAIVDGAREVSYAELERLSTHLALWLVRAGLEPEGRVGLFLPKCIESVVAVFGIMKAGGTYVPIDASGPGARAGHIMKDCGIGYVITTESQRSVLGQACAEQELEVTPIVVGETRIAAESPFAEEVRWAGVVESPAAGVLPAGTARDLAYILYTSGSTGLPKGVMISHRAALAFVDWTCEEFELSHGDVVSSHAPLHFDLSIFDIFSTVKAGGTIVLLKDGASTFPIQLTRSIEEHRITVWYSVPSALILMLERGKLAEADTRSLRMILFAGEVFPTRHLRKLSEATDARLFNLFGPTETNVCTFYEVVDLPEDDGETIPIGRAIAHYDVFRLDQDGRPCEPKEPGELYARGPGLMSGYWGDTVKTERSLLQNPLHDRYRDPVYRTGDIATIDSQGRFRFIGRRDHQVKIRGYRVELGEIEAAMSSTPGVAEAVAVVVPDEGGDKKVVGLAVAVGGASLTEEGLSSHCESRLPRYMVPETMLIRRSLPHTSTGKVDRQEVLRQFLASEGHGG